MLKYIFMSDLKYSTLFTLVTISCFSSYVKQKQKTEQDEKQTEMVKMQTGMQKVQKVWDGGKQQERE